MGKFAKLSLLFGFIVTLYVNGVKAESVNEENEDRFMIFIKHDFEDNKSPEYKTFLYRIINNIHELIVNNKDSYKNQAYLKELEDSFNDSQGKTLSDYGPSPYVYPISSIGDSTVLFSYLTTDLVKDIESMDNIVAVERDKKMTLAEDKPKTSSFGFARIGAMPTQANDETDDSNDAEPKGKGFLGNFLCMMRP